MTETPRLFYAINKNFCHRPLARSRMRGEWEWSEQGRCRVCELPGLHTKQPRVVFTWSAEKSRGRRLPDDFDMALLFTLLRDAQMQRTGVLRYGSISAIIRSMGLEPTTRHRNYAASALALWSALGVWFERWQIGRQQARQSMTLPPPIRVVGDGVTITLAKRWCTLNAAGYFTRIPRLPLNPAQQNLVLWLYAVPKTEDGVIKSVFNLRAICRKIGLNHAHRNERLAQVIKAVKRWFADQGGALRASENDDGYLTFKVTKPPLKKSKKRKQSASNNAAPKSRIVVDKYVEMRRELANR